MTKMLDAVYEGGVLKPLGHLDLPEHQKVHLLIQTDIPSSSQKNGWHWRESQTIADGYAGSVSDEVSRQRQGR